MTTRLCDLPHELVGAKILTKVPLTSLREVRSTCKLWNGLSKNWIVGEAAPRQHQFLGFMLVDSKVSSLRFHIRRNKVHAKEEEEEDLVEEEEDLVDLDVKQSFALRRVIVIGHHEHIEASGVEPKGQTRWIRPRTDTRFHTLDNYAFGYDTNRNHKILRFLDYRIRDIIVFVCEIYDLASDSWRVLELIRPNWELEFNRSRGVSLKGNTYFLAYDQKQGDHVKFLVCFDFTTERFGQLLDLPFQSFIDEDIVNLSSVRDEKLALLRHELGDFRTIETLEIWVTTKIEPNGVTWSKFMNVDMRPLIGDREEVFFDELDGSFFIDEEEKIAVVFDLDDPDFRDEHIDTPQYHTAFIIGEEGYYRTVSLGVILDDHTFGPPLVCSSSYLPSLVQLNKPRKRKERDES